jgi:hypothetical protein
MIIEPSLKLFLYIDNWLNGCVAGERAFAVFKGISFNKKQSKKMAKWIIIYVILINIILFLPQIIYLNLVDIVFVLPSSTYKNEFKQVLTRFQRYFKLL